MNRTDFDRFVAGSADGLLRTAYLIVWDLPEAEDLIQETLLKVARRWPKVSRIDHPAAYARRILINLALAERPKRARRAELHDSSLIDARSGHDARSATAGATDATSAIDAHDELYAALATLPPRQRAVIVLRYFLDLSEAETAAALGCSLGTVKSTASRGLARLEQTLRPTNDTRSIAT
jgi:RNA polymerase sigma-70 factor (sigma-E family)